MIKVRLTIEQSEWLLAMLKEFIEIISKSNVNDINMCNEIIRRIYKEKGR